MRVAGVDFFQNIEPPRVRLRAHRDSLPPRLPMMLRFGERSNSWN